MAKNVSYTIRLPMMKKTISLLLLSIAALGAAEQAPEFKQRERIAYVGNSLGVRMAQFGHLETLLHARFPQRELVIRGFARPADEVGLRQRPNDYTFLDDPLAVFAADTFICFFGYNESFAGPAGVEKYKADYKKFIAETNEKYGKNQARFILVSPIAFENANDPLRPSGQKENENLRAYTAATAEVARELSLPFVDVFADTQREFAKEPGAQFTSNGFQINEAGDRLVGGLIDRALFSSANPLQPSAELFQKVRAAVSDKAWVHQQDYRMLNGWYVYGSRRAPYDVETFPEEYKKIRAMATARDEFIWSLVQGKATTAGPDDSKTGELKVPKTAFGTKKYSEPAELRFLGGEEALSAMTTAPGFKVSLFASEAEFPELAKPVQVNFDNKGRLWVACMPTYPQWKPGDPKPSDRLLIFEDSNSDGKADKVKVFYDQLHCATSFEFWNGGVLVFSQPAILFIKDTDGDDKADQVVEWSDGWASDDTHHRGGFEWSHGGLLHVNEGVSMSTTLETPYGPFRNRNSPGSYVIDPRTLKIRHFVTPGYGNPWCYVFDTWGQGFVGDGTTAQQHWDTPLSGAEKGSRRGLNPVFNTEGMRPVIGSEFLWSRHLPEEVQGQFIYACVINMNGIPRWEIRDDSAGYTGKRLPDLLKSTDKNFRPGDPKIGPDGAIWFIDWHNPLIGHMQYSQRDPNRDHTRGRVYRLTAEGRPLLQPVTQFGKSIPELLDQLKTYERRTRYAARRELWDRPKQDVLAAVDQWLAKQNPSDPEYDRLMAEAVWVQEGHRAVAPRLLQRTLAAKTPEARAAAVRVLANEWDRLPQQLTMASLKNAVADDHPRVRVEALRTLSYVPSLEAAELAVKVVGKPMDYYLDYTLEHTLRALEPQWKQPFEKGQFAGTNSPAHDFVAVVSHGRPELVPAMRSLRALIQNPGMEGKGREEAMQTVARAKGRANAGKDVYARVCVACHKIGNEGIDFGPNLSDVGKRLKREELVESILYPNLKVDPKYLTVNITTKDGEELTGVVDSENDSSVSLKLGSGVIQKVAKNDIAKRETTKVSNMPEGLAESIQAEFVDLIEYLAAQK
jgi:putative heme-binding domain-containing protein